MPEDVRSMEELGASLHGVAEFLTIRYLKRVTIRIPNQCPVAYWRSGVFRFSGQTFLFSRKLAQAINVLP